MDVASPAAPPVVAVTVVHEPGEWFSDVLVGLRDQDYPNLRLLFLVTGDADGVADRIGEVIADAHVRTVAGNPGYGPAADEAMRLVEGSGLFCFLHDDVALEPDAVTRLVEELYRSNAGIVGPKLVDWESPQVLQQVGVAIDRFGEPDPILEPGEVDQEQHDAVRDVFALPTACLLVRADLFRTLGGFAPNVDFHGDGLDLCWRAHLSGARVLVVPAARARHRAELVERRPDLPHSRLSASHRVRTVATLTGRWRTPIVLLQLVVVSIVEVVVGVFTGKARSGLASLYALGRLVPSLPSVIARRREVRALRLVPDREVAAMQLRGSARLVSFLRHRELTRRNRAELQGNTIAGDIVDRQPVFLAILLLVAMLVGSRQLIRGDLPEIGQFVRLPSPGAAWRSYLSAWQQHGFGSDASSPPALALLAIGGVVGLGRSGFVRTALVLAPFVLGPMGIWRSLSFVPSVRARMGAVIVYASVPLAMASLATGRWGALAVYGALPWAFLLLRVAGGLTVFHRTEWGDDDIADAVASVSARSLVRIVAALALLDAVIGAFAPSFPLLVVAVAVVLAGGTLLAGGARSVLTSILASLVALAISFVLLEPWSFSLLRSGGWDIVTGSALDGGRGLGALDIASFRIGPTAVGVLALAFYVPVLAAPLVGRAWRLTWAARAGSLVGVFLVLALLDDRDALPFRLPEPGILLAPVALGLAIAAACALAGFERDILSARFGWRQPLGLIVSVALAAGVFQGLVSVAGGRWSAPRLGLPAYLSQLPDPVPGVDAGGVATGAGDSRVLFVGDPRVLPLPGTAWRDGVSYAVAGNRIGVADLFPVPAGDGDRLAAAALDAIANEFTDRAGRLLSPLAVRYVVVPVDDGLRGGQRAPVATPDGLLDALGRQLDLRRVDSPNALVIYENTAWLPVASMLDPVSTAASREAGGTLAARSVGSAVGILTGADFARIETAQVPAGTLHLSVPDDGGWRVRLDGAAVDTRPAFGWSVAAELPVAGELRIERGASARPWLLLLQGLLVMVTFGLATGARLPRRRARHDRIELLPGDALPLLEFGDIADPEGFDLLAPRSSTVDADESTSPGSMFDEPSSADERDELS